MNIEPCSFNNGEGIRTSIFLSGCTHCCKGCFNQEALDFNAGQEFTNETLNKLLDYCNKEYVAGLSILGGEPMHQDNVETTACICIEFKNRFPDKTIWIWTGYTFDEILYRPCNSNQCYEVTDILTHIDVLIDGRFIEEQKDLTLKWRGSSNQRVIDVRQSLKEGKVILYAE